MARPASNQPTEVELQILRILWHNGPSPVRDIHQGLQADKQTNYSTTVKMLAVMLEKGLVKRDETVSPYVYQAAITQQRTQKKILDSLVQQVYDGSRMSLVMQALSTGRASAEEIEEVRALLDKLERKQS
ncbi:Methicillin resistance regulatory protein MecI [Gimesia alba]|uniref:Methicillin resistance regulatory protein MecI n=1 Tax=Gimesia alba TaxID=2527973 RepID=A0A517RM92_9PLAN|nr:BlaI/MecI/CopY family transcriptional regulator [Gimesia alba]QDT44912.1 Methicillin resistance regulatory protein MecI [Gimesia alba]